jgi:hypothetical protein
MRLPRSILFDGKEEGSYHLGIIHGAKLIACGRLNSMVDIKFGVKNESFS